MRFVFIIGSPRSGTTWLQSMLGVHSSICTFPEIAVFSHYLHPCITAWDKQTKILQEGNTCGVPLMMNEQEFYEWLRELALQIYFKALASKPDAKIILDKHPSYSQCTQTISRLFPDARFIHIIRDGRDVAISLLASKTWTNVWRRSEDLSFDAQLWKKCVVAAREASAKTNHYLEIRYEEMKNGGWQALKPIFDFLEIDTNSDELRVIYESHALEKVKESGEMLPVGFQLPEGFIREGKIGGWDNIRGTMDAYRIHRIAGSLLQELGYANKFWWTKHFYQRYTLPTLYQFLRPFAVIRSFSRSRNA